MIWTYLISTALKQCHVSMPADYLQWTIYVKRKSRAYMCITKTNTKRSRPSNPSLAYNSTDSWKPPIHLSDWLIFYCVCFDTSSEKEVKMTKTQIFWWKTTEMPKKYLKALSKHIFMYSSHWPVVEYGHNFREMKK